MARAARLLITNADIYVPGSIVRRGSMLVDERGKIEAVTEAGRLPSADGAVTIDAAGMRLLPGFVDVHVHGGNGFRMMNATPRDVDEMSRFHAERGTTSFLATTDADAEERLAAALGNAADARRRTLPGAALLGVHLEGPYLDAGRGGAMDRRSLRPPDRNELRRLLAASEDSIRLVTMAPELPGGMETVSWLADRDITVSIGHSDATYDQVMEAVSRGARHTTHHFNGMRPLHHREPGVAGAGLANPNLTTELIADGFHVHPAVAKLLFDVKGPEGVCLVTDAVQCAGLPDGEYGHCRMVGGMVMLQDGSSLAGSSLTTIQALRNMASFTGYSISRLLPAITETPARQAGAADRKGSLVAGKDADFLLVDANLTIEATYVEGREVYRKPV
ncbi:N-acetylglucosamine-6-phosphate deacetylase [Paenibacillus sp.]|uniref:N-acetylglucosamine-6-phosphate deacetylase n=1 Tax=Paenibacillus sp. TaxID=58172 RepID=UPI002D69D007|nr:N-acetylglucosamine-6-phosphate deacetylase [Paenibacillus sp.]HZG55017.1 N-acetylglucosamine-6-phosphate deacetylase [Paenibacillus sp.]